jgi:preprotein translocase SecE subunit
MKKIINYFKGVWAELAKITWPTKATSFGLALLVLVLTLIMATYTGLLDLGFSAIVKNVITQYN